MSNGDMFATQGKETYQGKYRSRLPLKPKELSKEELELLERFKNADVGFDEIQREVAVRVFRKILLYPEDISVRDWLQSELIKVKREESKAKVGAMEAFVRKLFSGNLPTHCPHCNAPLFQEGEILNGVTTDHPALLPQ